MNSLDFYKIVAVVSPFLTAALTSTITYHFALKGKKIDILYQNKISEYKAIAAKLVDFKMFCIGRIAHLESNEFGPWEEGAGTLVHRIEIIKVVELNTFYLSKRSKKCLEDLIGYMGILCNAELHIETGEDLDGIADVYSIAVGKIETCVETINKDLK